MKIATIAASAAGTDLSLILAEKLRVFEGSECEVRTFCFERYKKDGSEPFTDIRELTERIFGEFDALIFVCACGIAVRAIARYVRSKLTDPAVVVIDDGGKFAIPLLSGHIGGANALARRVAEQIGAVPVITTATDARGKFSPDLFAKANDLIVDDLEALKKIAAAVLNEESISLVSEFDMINIPEDFYRNDAPETGIDIVQKPSSKDMKHFPPIFPDFLARNIVLGLGCKRGVSADVIERRVFKAFEFMGYDFRQVVEIATIDLKRDEEGLLEFARRHALPIRFFTAEELMSVPAELYDLRGSDFVMKITGADNVSERAALLAADGGLILIPKSYPECTGDGVTVAAAAKPLIIDFAKGQE